MSGVNKVMVVGRLGSDPEIKTLEEGSKICKVSVATSEKWTDKQGEAQERTEWHRIVIFGKLADLCEKYLSKGRQAYFEGRLQTRSWDDESGQKKYSTEIVASQVQFLGGRDEAQMTESATSSTKEALETASKKELKNYAPQTSATAEFESTGF